jgi:hypothetical protein
MFPTLRYDGHPELGTGVKAEDEEPLYDAMRKAGGLYDRIMAHEPADRSCDYLFSR